MAIAFLSGKGSGVGIYFVDGLSDARIFSRPPEFAVVFLKFVAIALRL